MYAHWKKSNDFPEWQFRKPPGQAYRSERERDSPTRAAVHHGASVGTGCSSISPEAQERDLPAKAYGDYRMLYTPSRAATEMIITIRAE